MLPYFSVRVVFFDIIWYNIFAAENFVCAAFEKGIIDNIKKEKMFNVYGSNL